jgi:NAD(P)-dependent dehydrogenase (short-subunit alcohol dehydrogenase family)
MGALNSKVAIITGGTSGIGARTVELFVAESAQVVVAGRRKAEGESLTSALGPAAIFVRTDVTKESDVKALIEQTLAKFGRLDCLFNNAGNPGRPTPIDDLDMDHFDTVVATHLRGVVLGMKYAAPAMIGQGFGSISTPAASPTCAPAIPPTTLIPVSQVTTISSTSKPGCDSRPRVEIVNDGGRHDLSA